MGLEKFIKTYPWIAVAIVIVLTLIVCIWWHRSTSEFSTAGGNIAAEHMVASATFAGANESALEDEITVETTGSLGGMTYKDFKLEQTLASQQYR